jgi:hypothetical protein
MGEAPDAFVFTGENGRTIWRGTFNKLVKWSDAVTAIWATGLHFHDYADTCLMPTSGRSACSAVMSGLKMSA